MRRKLVMMLGAVLLVGCSAPTATDVVGFWGSSLASLRLESTGGRVDLQCGYAILDTWTLGSDGRLSATGNLFTGGGPLPIGGAAAHAATFSGQLRGNILELSFRVPDFPTTPFGPYLLTRDGPEIAQLCLTPA